jgi:molybdopterin converting factor small subunit
MEREEMVLDMGPIEECIIRDVLIKIAEVTAKEISSLIIGQDGKVRSAVRIVREGKDLQFSGGLGTKVRDGDCLSVFPLLAGG